MGPDIILDARIQTPLRDFTLDVALVARPGEVLALAGPSGAGKSSFLLAIAGLLTPDDGRIAVGGTTWFDPRARVNLAPERRSVGLVFQEYALFPHMSVQANVAFGGSGRAHEMIARMGIAHLARARPGDLSGGEPQRVALARALAREPVVVLLDEPFAALDPVTRTEVRGEVAAVLAGVGVPVVMVTHDLADAAALGARIAVLEQGRVLQEAGHADLMARPASASVARLVGANLLAGTARPGPSGLTEVVLDVGGVVLSGEPGSGRVGVVVDPWEVVVARSRPGGSGLNAIAGTVRSLAPVGNRMRVAVGPVTADITRLSAERLALREGDAVEVVFKALATRLVPLG